MKEPSPLAKALAWHMETPLSPEELKGFGPYKPRKRLSRFFAKVEGPSKEAGMKGWKLQFGLRGTF